MMRSSVDLPQPDGPISETNSPRRIVEVDALEGAVVVAGRRSKTLSTPLEPDDGRAAAASRLSVSLIRRASRLAGRAARRAPASADQHEERRRRAARRRGSPPRASRGR